MTRIANAVIRTSVSANNGHVIRTSVKCVYFHHTTCRQSYTAVGAFTKKRDCTT